MTERISSEKLPTLIPFFAVALFISAFLLFVIQPMFTKMVLPLLGGSPGVWNTAMLFFQTVLVAGYAYAHLIRTLEIRHQLLSHSLVLLLGLISLPVSIIGIGTPPVDSTPVLWLIGLLMASVGLPFFALSASAPLLQHWFARTGHALAQDPYFLYAASNVGSILALLSYPVLIEPNFKLQEQSQLWAIGYISLILLIATCALLLQARRSKLEESPVITQSTRETPDWGRRLHWAILAFAPSSLLLGVTAHITTEIAAVPLLWVIPLALYLLTFVMTFARRPPLPHSWLVKAQPFFVIWVAITFSRTLVNSLLLILPHLLVFFVTAMVCHGELVRRRPLVRDLTDFYLWIGIGGMMGGVFNAIIAPILFESVLEYPLALILACMLRPTLATADRRITLHDFLYPFSLFLLLAVPILAMDFKLTMTEQHGRIAVLGLGLFFILLSMFIYSFRLKPIRFGLGVGVLVTMSGILFATDEIVFRERSFFGVHTVKITDAGDYRYLIHGSTVHGAQHTDPERWKDKLTYFHTEGPIGQLFSAPRPKSFRQIGVLGLGTGTLSCYRKTGQTWTFFEIDPVVIQIARDSNYFHYMPECAGNSEVVLGDGRLSLNKMSDEQFDLLLMDAFASDSVPVHLITQEALNLYMKKLTPDGLVAFNISNRYMNFIPVLAKLAESKGFSIRVNKYRTSDPEAYASYIFSSDWAVIARTPEALQFLDDETGWEHIKAETKQRLWTDNFSNIVGILKWRQ